ncbi:YtxH domain-containing protein [Roseivirga sp. BDSF3-8]|uniref:YtxH domain-containing protein n=1 Tax=Roseivirga sp. BDSF3-8 TaxID=3241598 RepID=UPI0035324DBC
MRNTTDKRKEQVHDILDNFGRYFKNRVGALWGGQEIVPEPKKDNTLEIVTLTLGGFVVGFAGAVLLAAKSGEETRAEISSALRKSGSQIADKTNKEVYKLHDSADNALKRLKKATKH